MGGAVTGEEAALLGEDPDGEGAEGAAHTMHGDGTDGVIDADPVEERDGRNDERTEMAPMARAPP